MAANKLSDAQAKQILLGWPSRTKSVWPAPRGKGFWVRAQPVPAKITGPKISSPGAQLFKTQPDGLWVHFAETEYCDVVVIEVCGTIQNLNDKRSRYIPASHSIVLTCPLVWLEEEVSVQRGGKAPRWKATATITQKPTSGLTVPIRHLRVLYALPNAVYSSWCSNHTPSGYEFFCPHSSLDSYNSPKMQRFLKQMSIGSQFYVKP
jgi:hypothetical protein